MTFRNAVRMTFAAGLLAGAASVSMAQSTTEGAIAGTAEDATGAAIPKATIVIKNDGTASTQNLTADDSGYFKAPLLEPGVYTVTVAATGFGGFEQKVDVVVGKLTEVMPKLTSGSTTTTVDVMADMPVMNYESPDVTASLNRESIDAVPVQNRRWSALALTTPGVVADSSGFGLVSVRGISTVLNEILIDGADDNQAFYSEERGRTREAYSTSENSVQEFNVNTGVYSAQYGRAAGGVINSVTRSGTNQLHGELFFNDLDRGFGAYVPGSVSPAGLPLKPKDLRKIYGGSMGGYLMKDKLFWFYTYDQQSHVNPGIAKAKSYGSATTPGSFLDQPDALGSTCNATTGYLAGSTATIPNYTLDSQVCSLAARLGQTYATAESTYNSGLAALQTDLGIVPRVGYQEINTPKLDYQITPKERVSFLFHRLRWDAPGDVQTASTATYSVDAFGTDFIKLDYGLTKLTSQISANVTNEVLYQYSRELDDEGQQPYSAYTLANLQAPGGPAIQGSSNGPAGTIPYIGLATSIGFNLGSPYYSYRQALPDERKWQVSDVLYYSAGNHSIRVGGDVLHNYDLVKQTPYYFGDYTYGTVANYLTDLATKSRVFTGGANGTCNSTGAVGTATVSAVGTYACYSTVFQDYGATTFDFSTTDVSGFVQDNWKVSPRLTFELGLRYDIELLPPPTPAYTAATGTFVPYAGLNNTPARSQ